MRFLFLTALCVVALTVTKASFESGSDFSEDEKERQDNCKHLVSHDGDSSESSESGGSNGSGGSNESGQKPSSPKGGEEETDAPEVTGSSSTGSETGTAETSTVVGVSSSTWESSTGLVSSTGVSGTTEEPKWMPGEYCYLFQQFWKFSLTIEVSVEIQLVFQQWINETQLTIVQDNSLSEYEVLIAIWYSFVDLCTEYPELSVVKYEYVVGWGYVFDLEGLAIGLQSQYSSITVEAVITVGGSGSCPLCDCLSNATDGSSEQESAVQELISEIKVIIEGNFEFSYQMVLIYEKIQAFFEAHAEWKEDFYGAEIEGFGTLEAFFDISAVYWRIFNFQLAVGGSVSQCPLLTVLTECWQNSSSGMSMGEKSDIKGFTDKISKYFTNVSTVSLRIDEFQAELYQLFLLENWTVEIMFSLEIEGYGSFYDLIYAFVYCENNNITITPPTTTTSTTPSTTSTTTPSTTTKPTTTPSTTSTTTPSTTTKPTTTSTTTKPTTASTTVKTSTTTKPPTTTPLQGNCATVLSCNVFSSNTTKLLTAIDNDQVSWNATEKNQFLGYKKRIYNVSANTTTTYTVSKKFADIKTTLTGFASSTSNLYIKVHKIVISGWGTIAQYCNCPTPA